MSDPIRLLPAAVVACLALQAHGLHSQDAGVPEGYWSIEQATEILAKTRRVRLDPDLSALTDAELAAKDRLLKAGEILGDLYEDSRHPQALAARRTLAARPEDEETAALLDLYYLFKGPIATTLDNQRVPFLPVEPAPPGRNVYPWGLTTDEFDTFLESRDDLRAGLMHLRHVVRSTTAENLERDLGRLGEFPLLGGLHPGLQSRLEALRSGDDEAPWYALPYSVHWAPQVLEVYGLLQAAAEDVQSEDPDLAAYLRLRARDIVSDDYEGGDAAWVRGQFRHLNAQIGSYETYDDALYGVKSFFSLSLLARDEEKSRELESAIAGIQEIQDSLPMDGRRKVQENIPVGVYNVIADFGQARGGNTATILPNEADHARKYGRTILLRYNIMTHPDLFADSKAVYDAAVLPEFADDLTLDGNFYRTLWHEVGHYLGVTKTTDGHDLGEALSPWGDLYEEMKSDLISLYTVHRLHEKGLLDEATVRSVYASGVRRVLQRAQPRRDQPYQTMQLMQMNFFLDNGLLAFDEESGRLDIEYERYAAVVEKLLEEVLSIQAAGDSKAAEEFMESYTAWDETLHGRLAKRLRESSRYRYRMVKYRALEN